MLIEMLKKLFFIFFKNNKNVKGTLMQIWKSP